MKTPSALDRLLTSGRAGFLFQWALFGMLGGLVCALLLLHRQPPVYETAAQVSLASPGTMTSGAFAKRSWLDSQVTDFLSAKSLTSVAS
jgi:hypothetical protein